MKLNEIKAVIAEAFKLLPVKMHGDAAVVMLLAIGLQESRFAARRQVGGPARGFWQFELGGGVKGVLNHRSTRYYAQEVCMARGVSYNPNAINETAIAVYRALEHDDVLAACFARLLLWTNANPMPRPGDVEGSWQYYLATWRPGKPHAHTWPSLYAQALSSL